MKYTVSWNKRMVREFNSKERAEKFRQGLFKNQDNTSIGHPQPGGMLPKFTPLSPINHKL